MWWTGPYQRLIHRLVMKRQHLPSTGACVSFLGANELRNIYIWDNPIQASANWHYDFWTYGHGLSADQSLWPVPSPHMTRSHGELGQAQLHALDPLK
jgi:hypothetical protein